MYIQHVSAWSYHTNVPQPHCPWYRPFLVVSDVLFCITMESYCIVTIFYVYIAWFTDCPIPTKIDANLEVIGDSTAIVEPNTVLISGGTVEVSCNFTLYNLTSTAGEPWYDTTVTIECTDTDLDNSESGWQCLPTCSLRNIGLHCRLNFLHTVNNKVYHDKIEVVYVHTACICLVIPH